VRRDKEDVERVLRVLRVLTVEGRLTDCDTSAEAAGAAPIGAMPQTLQYPSSIVPSHPGLSQAAKAAFCCATYATLFFLESRADFKSAADSINPRPDAVSRLP